MKLLVYFVSVVSSAMIIACGAYVVSSGNELTLSDATRQFTFGWFSPLEQPAAEPPPVAVLQAQAVFPEDISRGFTLTASIINAAATDNEALHAELTGGLFLDVDGDYHRPDLPVAQSQELYAADFGFDYLFDFNYDDFTYQLYRLSPDAVIQSSVDSRSATAHPVLRATGGTPLMSGSMSPGTPSSSGTSGTLEPATDESDPDSSTVPIFTLQVSPLDEWGAIPFDLPENTPKVTEFTDPQADLPLAGEPLSPVPEPSTLLLLAIGLLCAFILRRRLG